MRNDCGVWPGKRALSRSRCGVTFRGDAARVIVIVEAVWRRLHDEE